MANGINPIMNLQRAIKLVNKYFYFVGDDCHNYAFAYISKELGDLLIKKYPNDINNGGLRIEPVENFNLSQTDLDKSVSDLESLWYQNLQYDMEIGKGYNTFEEWKKQEGFGDMEWQILY